MSDGYPSTREGVATMFRGFGEVLTDLQRRNAQFVELVEGRDPIDDRFAILARWTLLIEGVSAHLQCFVSELLAAAKAADPGLAHEEPTRPLARSPHGQRSPPREQLEALLVGADRLEATRLAMLTGLSVRLSGLDCLPAAAREIIEQYFALSNHAGLKASAFREAIREGRTVDQAEAIVRFRHDPYFTAGSTAAS